MQFDDYLQVLQKKWHELPAGLDRFSSKELVMLDDDHLLGWWINAREEALRSEAFSVRGWYHHLYKDVLKKKKVLDVGSGLGFDGITFAQNGACVTFLDIVEDNITILRRLCKLLDLNDVDFCYLDTIDSLNSLSLDFSVIWCQGSIHHAPFEFSRKECGELLKHLPIGGRWIELSYPKERWEREGKLPFEEWGKRTDGDLTPWAEWYDLEKLLARLTPAQFDVVLNFNFHNNDFIWFDLVRRS